MFWQNACGLLLVFVAASTGGWPISDRYRFVFATLSALLTSTISSFSGT